MRSFAELLERECQEKCVPATMDVLNTLDVDYNEMAKATSNAVMLSIGNPIATMEMICQFMRYGMVLGYYYALKKQDAILGIEDNAKKA